MSDKVYIVVRRIHFGDGTNVICPAAVCDSEQDAKTMAQSYAAMFQSYFEAELTTVSGGKGTLLGASFTEAVGEMGISDISFEVMEQEIQAASLIHTASKTILMPS